MFAAVHGAYHAYRAGEDTGMTDTEYDNLERQLLRANANALYEIEASVPAGYRENVELPVPMPGLTQLYVEADIVAWLLFGDEETILLDKEDGVSIQLNYGSRGNLISAYSKHIQTEGKDITRHAMAMKIPKDLGCTNQSGTFQIRAEIIMPIKVFEAKYSKTHGTGKYENGRNAVAGRVNSKTPNDDFWDDCLVIAYSVTNNPAINRLSKSKQLKALSDLGFEVPHHRVIPSKQVNLDFLTKYTLDRKIKSPTEIDGIVIEFNSSETCEAIGFEGDDITPKYARKFKVLREEDMAITTVIGIDWRVHKDGHLKGRAILEPVRLCGVTVKHASIFNAYYVANGHLIWEDKPCKPIGIGAKVKIARSGDVIPDIQEIIKPAKVAGMPDPEEFGEMIWSETGVDLICVDKEAPAIRFKRMVHFFGTIGVPDFGGGMISKLFEAGFDSVDKILRAKYSELVVIEGVGDSKANTIIENVAWALDGVKLPVLMAATGYFGRGVGTRRLEEPYNYWEGDIVDWTGYKTNEIAEAMEELSGWGGVNSILFSLGIQPFKEFIARNKKYIRIAEYEAQKIESSKLEDIKVVFTGFRDAELGELIVANGGVVQSGVNGETTYLVVKDISTKTAKMTAALAKGVNVIERGQFSKLISKKLA